MSCIESYSCYLQQCSSVDLFYYWTPARGQKSPMNKFCFSFCPEVFFKFALRFFFLEHGVRDPCGVIRDRAGFIEKNIFAPKMGKIG